MQAWRDWDLPSLFAQLEYWRKHPPVHLLVAAYLDYTPAPLGADKQAADTASIEALMAMAPPMPEHLKARIPGHGRL